MNVTNEGHGLFTIRQPITAEEAQRARLRILAAGGLTDGNSRDNANPLIATWHGGWVSNEEVTLDWEGDTPIIECSYFAYEGLTDEDLAIIEKQIKELIQ